MKTICALLLVFTFLGCEPPKEKWKVILSEPIDKTGWYHVRCQSDTGELTDMFMDPDAADKIYPLNHVWFERKPNAK